MGASVALRAVELECERTILDAAAISGWRRHGERVAMSRKGWRTPVKGEVGWPDLVLARPGVLIVAELKRKPNEPDPEQLEWLRLLDTVPGCWGLLVWVPEDQDDFCHALFEIARHTSLAFELLARWQVTS